MITVVVQGGFGKTGSTFLRKKVFSKLEDVVYFGFEPFISPKCEALHLKLFVPLYNSNDYTFSARNSSSIIKEYGDLIVEEMRARPSKNIAVLSDPSILDFSNHNAELNIYLVKKLFDYLKKTFGNSVEFKFMATIRNQSSILQSVFAYDYHHLKARFKSFEEFISCGVQNSHDSLFGGYFYDEILQELMALFGGDKVQFFIYEQLKEDPEGFVSQVLEFVGTKTKIKDLELTQKINQNSGPDGSNFIRDFNWVGNSLRWLYSLSPIRLHELPSDSTIAKILKPAYQFINNNFVKEVKYGKIKLSEALSQKISAMYCESNQNLSNMLDTDLRYYGYCIDPEDNHSIHMDPR